MAAFLMFFVFVFFAWMWVVVLFDPGFNGVIRSQIVVDSPQSAGWEDFLTSPSDGKPDIPPYYELWWFYNLTNVEEIKQGHNPVVKEVGPYVYSQIKIKINISFPDDGNVIRYRQCESWQWEPELSAREGCVDCDPDRDIITNVNPGYMGAIAQAGGEVALSQGFTGPSMAKIFAFMNRVFVPDIFAFNTTGQLPARQHLLLPLVSSSLPEFYDVWANATQLPNSSWAGMLVSLDADAPSGISLATAQELWNARQVYSLLNTELESYLMWGSAVTGNTSAQNFLAAKFALSEQQTTMLCSWLRDQFWPLWVEPSVLSQFGVPDKSALPYVQWGLGTVSPVDKKGKHLSIQAMYPSENFGAKPEFALWGAVLPGATMNWPNAVQLWGNLTHPLAGNPLGLFNAENWAYFAQYAFPVNLTALGTIWGISSNVQLRVLELYFADMGDKISQPNMAYLASIGGGVITSRTVNSWAWKAIDPLLLFLKPESADVALQGNLTSIEECLISPKVGLDNYNTGKDKINTIGNTLTFLNMSVLPASWYNESYPPVPVHGVNSAGQFQPFLHNQKDLFVFDNNFIRTLKLTHYSNITVKGVNAFRYMLANDNFLAPNYRYNINKPEFQGFCNLSGPQQGAPVFLGQAHMYGAHEKFVRKVTGMPQADPVRDPTWVDIEPYTGKVIQVDQALQLNIYNPCSPDWFAFSPFGNELFACDVMFPVAIIRQYSVLDSTNVEQVTGQLYLGLRLKKIVYGIFLGIGLCALALSALLGWLAIRRLRALETQADDSESISRSSPERLPYETSYKGLMWPEQR